MKTASDYSKELKKLFPGDSARVRMAFAMALKNEAEGNAEKANEYLEKTIKNEELDNA